jgi:hypothetical protein
MTEHIHRVVPGLVKFINEAQRMIRVRLSDATLDRMGQSIPLSAWKQPLPKSIPINIAHDNTRLVIARGYPQLLGDDLYADIVFPPPGVSAEADQAYALVKHDIVTDVAWSAGSAPMERPTWTRSCSARRSSMCPRIRTRWWSRAPSADRSCSSPKTRS